MIGKGPQLEGGRKGRGRGWREGRREKDGRKGEGGGGGGGGRRMVGMEAGAVQDLHVPSSPRAFIHHHHPPTL